MEIIIEQGALQGLQSKTLLSDKPYISYLGIPYAKPPVDDLRFKAPVKHPGWSGVFKAVSEGNKCTQYALLSDKIVGNEDCLYLNVLVPQNETNEKLAVMVFIHGGAFNFGCGSVNDLSPDYLLDENVIVVLINYRLNVLGFLNLDIDDCSGNMGLKDQLLAIKWTKANISAFGGDADNITIFGESAGSASVHYHTLSPQSTGFFHKAIMQSGCAFNPWALNDNHKEAAFKLASNLGCLSNDPREILKYLKNVPAIDLVKETKFKDNVYFLDYKFIPSVESATISNPFLPARPEYLVNIASPVPVIIGLNDMEGIIGLSTEERISQFDGPHIPDEINNLLRGRCSAEVINKINEFYFNEHNIESETTKFENICHLHSDIFFLKDFYRGIDHFLRQDITPVYNYKFKFDGELNVCKNMFLASRPALRKAIKGACHADDVYYLFHGKLIGLAPKPNSPELKMCKMMSKLWSNFAKTGDPNSQDLSFNWINSTTNNLNYLSINGDKTRMAEGMINSSRISFWRSLFSS